MNPDPTPPDESPRPKIDPGTTAGIHTVAKTLQQSDWRRIWISWFSAMSIALVAIVASMLIGQSLVVVSALIILLFLSAVWKSWRDIYFLGRETKIASGQVRRLQDSSDLGVFLQKEKPSIFKTHIQSLRTMFETSPQFGQDSLIEVLHARLLARNKTVELFSSVLITLGLIGTILGLIQSVGGLSGLTNTDDIISSLTEVVGGLDTAFYTTLFGAVLGGVFLRILCSVVDSAILSYTAHIGELTEVYVLPSMRRTAKVLEEGGYYRKLPTSSPAPEQS